MRKPDPIYITGELSDEHLHALSQAQQNHFVLISSGGGNPDRARGLVDWIRLKECTTVAWGNVASAALPVFAAGRRRWISPSASFVWHEPYFNREGECVGLQELEFDHRTLRKWLDWACRQLAIRSGSHHTMWQEMALRCGGSGTEFSAQEIADLGLGVLLSPRSPGYEALLCSGLTPETLPEQSPRSDEKTD